MVSIGKPDTSYHKLPSHLQKSLKVSFGDIPENVKECLQQAFADHLGDIHSAKYPEVLQIVRDLARISRGSDSLYETSLAKDIISSVKKLLSLDVDDESINTLIESTYNKNLHYYNVEKKIDALGDIVLLGNNWMHNQHVEKQISQGIGGSCAELASALYKDLMAKDIIKNIEHTTGQIVSLNIYSGESRTHFKGSSTHIFLVLTIGEQNFILDPSFGDIVEQKESGYSIKKLLSPEELSKTQNLMTIGYLHIPKKEGDKCDRKYGADYIPLGLLPSSKVYIELSFLRVNNAQTIPVFSSVNPQGEGGLYFMDKGALYFIDHMTQRIHTQKEISSLLSQEITSAFKRVSRSDAAPPSYGYEGE